MMEQKYKIKLLNIIINLGKSHYLPKILMDIKGISENDAILTLVDNLREDCDFISEIVEIYETNK